MKELEQSILNYLQERKWDNPRPGDLAKSIMIEGAELLELFQWENLTIEEVKAKPEKLEGIKKELADVFIYAIELSTLLGLDTKQIIKDKLELAAIKYPADVMRKYKEKEEGDAEEYWKIKKEYRRNA